jgi:hypothetical protein
MSRRETRAEAIARADAAQRDLGVQQLAVRFLACSVAPDFETTVTDSHGGTVHVRAFGLARMDGGIVVLVWREGGQNVAHFPRVEASYMLDVTRPAALRGHAELGRHKLADALSKIYNKHVQCCAPVPPC